MDWLLALVLLAPLASEDPLGGIVSAWIGRLASPEWRVREEATHRLVELGETVLPYLPELRDVSDPETAGRLEFVRRRIERARRLTRVSILVGTDRDVLGTHDETAIAFTLQSTADDWITVRDFRVEVYGPDGVQLAPVAHRRTTSPIGSPRCVPCLEESARFLRLFRDEPLERRLTIREGVLSTPAVPYRAGHESGRHWFEYDVSAPGVYRIVYVSEYSDEDYARHVREHPSVDPSSGLCWGLTDSAPMARALRGRFAAGAEFEIRE